MDDRNELQWVDQPLECADAEVVARIYMASIGVVDVRRGPSHWFVTVGGMQSSQTLRCPDAAIAWRALDAIYNAPEKRRPIPPPAGTSVVPPPRTRGSPPT